MRIILIVIQLPDGTVSVSLDDLVDPRGANRAFERARIPVKVVGIDREADAPAEVDWGDAYADIVVKNGPDEELVLQPLAIPAGTTLLLAARRRRDDMPGPRVDVRILLVYDSPPDVIGGFFPGSGSAPTENDVSGRRRYPAAPPGRAVAVPRRDGRKTT
jgi:hypothetical protein